MNPQTSGVVGGEAAGIPGLDRIFQHAGSSTQDFAAKNITANGPVVSTAGEFNLKVITALADAAATLTAAQLDGGMFTIAATIARILTTDTAVAILAAIPGHVDGTHFEFTIVNTGAGVITLSAGVGVTLVGVLTAGASSGTWRVIRTGAAAVSMFRI